MKKLIALTLLVSTMAPAFAFDNSASAWEFRRKQCDYVAQRAGIMRARAMAGLPEQPVPEESRDKDLLYTLTVETSHTAYTSKGTPDDAASAAFAKCLDNIDRIATDWREGVKTDPKWFR